MAEEDNGNIDYDQVSITCKFKVITAEIILVICSIFWTNLYSMKSHHQMK